MYNFLTKDFIFSKIQFYWVGEDVDFSLVLQLEEKVDRLLARKQALEETCRELQAEKDRLVQERDRFVAEVDRILAKLDGLDQEVS